MTEEPATQIVPLGSASSAVDAYRAAGGVVEYVLVATTASVPADAHQAATIRAVAELASRDDTDERDADPDRAVGRPVGLDEFLGRAFDPDGRRIVSAWTPDPDGGPGASKGLAERLGYAEAFSDPPYPLRADLDQVNAWFTSINRDLFGGLDDDLTVWSWSTDWSAWFDLGHEWWGAVHWTVERPGSPWITVISAATTD